MAKYRKGSEISWKWLGKAILGKVEAVYLKPITQEIKTKKITRNGSKENPAYLVCSEAGNQALKLESELSPIVKPNKSSPKIFS